MSCLKLQQNNLRNQWKYFLRKLLENETQQNVQGSSGSPALIPSYNMKVSGTWE